MFSQKLEDFLIKNRNKKIIFTNGCFDIIHKGHVAYLAEAKKLGDLLVVGLNSDASTKRLKGPERPINSELDRQYVMSQLKPVDFVEIFEEDTPLNLILKVKPQVLVKGGDWKIEQIVGGKEVIDAGGNVYSLNFVDGYSTTSIIQKIQAT
ncbi:MAG: D-glycero-beta-D-manno-heptose 1-phosphate adenylyltransferase [Bdellovibrionales bacterium]|nr:D-glycero-beta-D-manno-heptose 1-phosphate adenylyltransferase [Bdellovibrionales bacterium]